MHHFALMEENDTIADVRHQSETVGYDNYGAGALDHIQDFLL